MKKALLAIFCLLCVAKLCCAFEVVLNASECKPTNNESLNGVTKVLNPEIATVYFDQGTATSTYIPKYETTYLQINAKNTIRIVPIEGLVITGFWADLYSLAYPMVGTPNQGVIEDGVWSGNTSDLTIKFTGEFRPTVMYITYEVAGFTPDDEFGVDNILTKTWYFDGFVADKTNVTLVDYPFVIKDGSDAGDWTISSTDATAVATNGKIGSSVYSFNGSVDLSNSDFPENALIKEVSVAGRQHKLYSGNWTFNVDGQPGGSVAMASTAGALFKNVDLAGNDIEILISDAVAQYIYIYAIAVKYVVADEDTPEPCYFRPATADDFVDDNSFVVVGYDNDNTPVVMGCDVSSSGLTAMTSGPIWTISNNHQLLRIDDSRRVAVLTLEAYGNGYVLKNGDNYLSVGEGLMWTSEAMSPVAVNEAGVTFNTGAIVYNSSDNCFYMSSASSENTVLYVMRDEPKAPLVVFHNPKGKDAFVVNVADVQTDYTIRTSGLVNFNIPVMCIGDNVAVEVEENSGDTFRYVIRNVTEGGRYLLSADFDKNAQEWVASESVEPFKENHEDLTIYIPSTDEKQELYLYIWDSSDNVYDDAPQKMTYNEGNFSFTLTEEGYMYSHVAVLKKDDRQQVASLRAPGTNLTGFTNAGEYFTLDAPYLMKGNSQTLNIATGASSNPTSSGTTGICNVIGCEINCNEGIYNLQGVRITSVGNLPAGVYILVKNGRATKQILH